MKKVFDLSVWSLVVVLAGPAQAGPDTISCLIDQDHYTQQSLALAGRHRGAHYDPVTNLVSWTSAKLGQVTVRIGGCENFWLEASVKRKASRLSSQTDAISMIKSLIRAEWPAPYANDAARLLSRQPDEVRQWNKGSVSYFYKRTSSGEIVLEQNFDGDMEAIRFSLEP